ncbi:MAG: flagellar basal body rod protein FlgF [Pseudomonadota bacterium]
MDHLIYTAMSGAKQAFSRQAGVAQSLANATTTGYRDIVKAFRAVSVQGAGLPTRAFVVETSSSGLFEPGPMISTGRPLDVAVQGAGWIAVQGADGNEAYTRAGNLQPNANGQLQTAAGFNVLGEDGALTLPPDSRVLIAADGTVSAIPLFGVPNNVSVVGRIKLVNPPEADLLRGADGLFRLKSGTPADADANVKLASETLEGSNVNSVRSMIDMIGAARFFDMQMKVIKAADENANKAGQLLTAR